MIRENLLAALQLLGCLAMAQEGRNPVYTLAEFGSGEAEFREEGGTLKVTELRDDEFFHDMFLARGFDEEDLLHPFWVLDGGKHASDTRPDTGRFGYAIPTGNGFKVVRRIAPRIGQGDGIWGIGEIEDFEKETILVTQFLSAMPVLIFNEYPTSWAGFRGDLFAARDAADVLAVDPELPPVEWDFILDATGSYRVESTEVAPFLYAAQMDYFHQAFSRQRGGRRMDSTMIQLLGSHDPLDGFERVFRSLALNRSM